MRRIVIFLISVYQWTLSPWLGRHCRFTPTCSHYAKEAITCYGCFKGGLLAVRRILSCHPWHEGGYDPVPQNDHHEKGRLNGL